jgi:hypothetical protein
VRRPDDDGAVAAEEKSVDGGRGMLRAAVPSASNCAGVAIGRSRPSVVKTTVRPPVRIGGDGGRNPELHVRVCKRQLGSRDADDRPLLTVDLEGTGHRGSIGSEPITPHAIGQDHGWRSADRILTVDEETKKRAAAGVTRSVRNTDGETDARAGAKVRGRIVVRDSRTSRTRPHPQ